MARTIPAPTHRDFNIAFSSAVNHAKDCGFDVNTPKMVSFLTDISEVQAAMAAEIRWLRNMMHPK